MNIYKISKNIIIKAVIMLSTILSFSVPTMANSPMVATPQIQDTTGYIFIGDSRFVGMDSVCNISKDNNKFVIAKVGEGYDYLKNTAEPRADKIISSHPEFTNWKYIICLGVNDLGNVKKYKEEFGKIALTHDLTLVSVNPVEYHSYITNESIVSFNQNISTITGINYIDSYSPLIQNGFSTRDGVHFTKETYKDIYNIIATNINNFV